MKELKLRFWHPDYGMRSEFDGWCEGIGINEAIQSSVIDYGFVISHGYQSVTKRQK